ncbi:sensor histidine kinase [Schaalia sp. Marseille-Q2122]|uniref:sensor histidine kinase n=1 Tax=Schaalia sp. Marseille-Q2122 TaxID=2736604 RepID=UPI00158C926B|nr:histidine kinase [Schaalia sp. Marseille-Q2122]
MSTTDPLTGAVSSSFASATPDGTASRAVPADPVSSVSSVSSGLAVEPRSWRSQRSTYLTLGLCLSTIFMVMGIEGVSSWVVWGIRLGLLALIVVTIWSVRSDRRAHRRELQALMVHRAIAEERLRLARNLHDIISDGLGTISVRATVAHRLSGREGPALDRLEQARLALDDISVTSRQTVDQLRKMLEILHTPPTLTPPVSEPSTPAPGTPPPLAPHASAAIPPARDVAAIIDGARRSGLVLDIDDPLGYLALTDSVSPALMGRDEATSPITHGGSAPSARILPAPLVEALHCGLQNAARHAGPTHVTVAISVGEGVNEGEAELLLYVRDEGPADGWVPSPGAGVALHHLAHTCETAGGSMRAGPTPTGGFLLTAAVPLPILQHAPHPSNASDETTDD